MFVLYVPPQSIQWNITLGILGLIIKTLYCTGDASAILKPSDLLSHKQHLVHIMRSDLQVNVWHAGHCVKDISGKRYDVFTATWLHMICPRVDFGQLNNWSNLIHSPCLVQLQNIILLPGITWSGIHSNNVCGSILRGIMSFTMVFRP